MTVASPDAFFRKYIGQRVDVDGFPPAQPYQCYDLWARFIMDAYGTRTPIVIRPTDYAKDIWNNFDGMGLGKYFTKVTGKPQDGDWVIYGNAPHTPDSHVAMYRLTNANGTITILGQNQPQPAVTQAEFTTAGILGYIRPHIFEKAAKPTNSKGGYTVTEDDLNAIYSYGPLALGGYETRKRGIKEGSDVYLGKTAAFVLTDHFASMEAKNRRAAESNKVKSLQTKLSAEQSKSADLTAKLAAANETITELQAATPGSGIDQATANEIKQTNANTNWLVAAVKKLFRIE